MQEELKVKKIKEEQKAKLVFASWKDSYKERGRWRYYDTASYGWEYNGVFHSFSYNQTKRVSGYYYSSRDCALPELKEWYKKNYGQLKGFTSWLKNKTKGYSLQLLTK